MSVLTVYQGEKRTELSFTGSRKVMDLLTENGIRYPHPCGGHGRCGNCVIRAEGALSEPDIAEIRAGARLSCRTHVLGDASVWLEDPEEIVVEGASPAENVSGESKGKCEITCAIDIGTTTVALRIYSDGTPVYAAGFLNPQTAVAADVMGRISHDMCERGSNGDRPGTLTGMIREGIEKQMALSGYAGRISRGVITGNTTMLYLLTGRGTGSLSAYPFQADHLFDETAALWDIPIYLPECMHAFVGADITCAVLASGMCESMENGAVRLLCDVGTNGEIALLKNGTLYVSSTAAGPAFEGAGIACGCAGVPGAIEKVTVEDGQLKMSVIGGRDARGICGSGLVDAVAALLARGDMDESGYMEEEARLTDAVYLTQKDIRNVQLAKAAVCAGILTVLAASGTLVEEVDEFYIAGGFGSHLDVRSAAAIGLFPKELLPKAKVIGNAALHGAEMILLSEEKKEESRRIAAISRHVDLGGDPVFNEQFIECMDFE